MRAKAEADAVPQEAIPDVLVPDVVAVLVMVVIVVGVQVCCWRVVCGLQKRRDGCSGLRYGGSAYSSCSSAYLVKAAPSLLPER